MKEARVTYINTAVQNRVGKLDKFLPVQSITSYFDIVINGHSKIDLRIFFKALHISTRASSLRRFFCGVYWDVYEIVTWDAIIAWPRVYVPIWSNRATEPHVRGVMAEYRTDDRMMFGLENLPACLLGWLDCWI
jgi:hypothetical protein